ncbi:hypothetical protein ACVWWG_008415 [Bradyrhizobium sp. LB7.2]
MDSGACAGESDGSPVRGQPPAMPDTCRPNGVERRVRIADAIDLRAQLQFGHRFDQKFVELGAAFAVAPIADPDDIIGALDMRQRMIQGDVRGLVPGEGPVGPAELQIDLTKHLAEGEHTVEPVEVELRKLVRCADGAVMGVVEQQREGSAMRPPVADVCDQIRRIPFVDDDEIGAVERLIQIEAGVIAADADAGKQHRNVLHGLTATLADRVQSAPAVDRLEHDDLMTERMKFAGIAAQEVGVAVVPAGGEGVVEQDAFHARTSIWLTGAVSRWEASRSS